MSLLLAMCLLVAKGPAPASAAVSCAVPTAGTPGISLTKDAPSEVLYGEPIPITLTASQQASPPGAPESGFNLSFRDVLAPGVSYVSGSAPFAPKVIADQPSPGFTTLIFSNVADLAPNSDFALEYEVQYSQITYDAGDTIVTGTVAPPAAAGAYVNCDPRQIARFDANGFPTGTPANSYSSEASTAPSATELRAVRIEKSEPSPEHELLRGVHDNKTPYTITVSNNLVNPSEDLTVTDYLPAGLEFLGCGDVDNTTDAPTNSGSQDEYPGSGSIAAGPNPALPEACPTPEEVEFGSFDPDGPGPATTGLYTRVFWNLGPAANLAPAAEFSFNYVAAIPICPNTTTWTGATPTATSLGQIANLDNNSCAGGETADETALTNYASAQADYMGGGPPVVANDGTSLTVTAEDLAIWKEADPETFIVGELNRWSLHVRTSEYRTFDNVVINDTAPNGTCPVTGVNPPATPSPDADCADTGIAADNPIPEWAGASENPDGTWSLSWNLGSMDHNEETLVEFSTKTREFYQSGFDDAGPVLSGDTLTNNVDITGDAFPICSDPSGVIACTGGTPPYIAHTETPGAEIIDDSEATITTITPELNKQVAIPASLGQPVDCDTGSGASYIDGPAGPYRPGDIVCWKLRIDFQGGISTGGVTITDFLPLGTSYVAGVPGTGPTANNDVGLDPVVDNDTFIEFPLSAPDDTVDDVGHVFEYIIATEIDNVVTDPTDVLPPIRGNLLKLTTANTAEQATTYRDEAEFESAEPLIGIAKGVHAVNGNTSVTGKPDDVTVAGNDVVTFHVDVSNTGPIDAINSVVEEHTPSPYNCSTLSNYANAGIAATANCVNSGGGATLTWTGVDVDAGTTTTLAFDFTVTDVSSPFTSIPDVACVYSYDNATNQSFPSDTFTHYPDNSLESQCTTPPGPTPTPPAYDESQVIGGGSFVKSQTTSVTETNNNALTQATIGETVSYTVAFTLPRHMTVTNMTVADTVPTGLTLVPGSPQATFDGGALPGGMNVASPGGVPTLTIGTYTNTTETAQVFTLTFAATVADIGGNTSGTARSNTARRSFTDQFGVAHTNVNSNTTTTTVVEPNPAVSKNENDSDDVVSPGQEVEYTVTVTNPNRGSGPASSPLHETTVVDTIPVGLTPTNGSGTPIADGGTVVRCDGSAASPSGVWNDTANTITWTVGDVAPVSSTPLRYCVEVDSSPAPAGGQTLSNSVALSGTSMAGAVTGERTYNRSATDNVRVAGTATTKSVSDTTPTIGQTVSYTLAVTLPANTQFYAFRVDDDIPAGLTNVAFGSYTCVSGCPPTPTAPTTSVDGDGDLIWSFGDIAAHTAARVINLTYTARVSDVADNQQGTTLTNTAGPTWCIVATVPCPGPSIVTPPPATQTLTLTEPNLTIDKDVSCQTGDADSCNVQPGDSFTYTVTIDNTGNETAYNSIIQDAVPAGLTNVIVGTLPPGVTTATPTSGYSHAWEISSLAPADAPIVITYTADLAASSNFNNLETVVNTARVTQYFGLNGTDRTGNPDAREYPEGADPEDTVTLTVHVPQPQVVKTVANGGDAEINQPLLWTLTISNTDSVAALNDIDVVDALPPGWNYVTGSTERNGVAYTDPVGPNLTWTNVGDIAGGGASIILTFQATPTMAALVAGEADNPYTNNVDIDGIDASGATGSGDGAYEDDDSEDADILLPLLEIAKTPDDGTWIAGTWNDFTITLTNTGPGTARDVEINDAVPADLTYNLVTHPVTAVCAPAPCDNFALDSSSTTDIDWTLDSLPASGSITITVPMFVAADTADGATFTNTAGALSTERPTPVTDTGDVNIETEADLAITKAGAPDPGTAGENIVYTITATNNGPSDASGVEIHDSIDLTEFNFVSAVAVTSGDSCTTSGSPIDQIDCAAAGILEPGDSRVFTVTLQVKSGLVDPVTNTATVDGDQTDPEPDNNTSTEVIPLGTTSALTITKDVSTGEPSSIPNHDETEFTIVVENTGPSDALSVEVDDELPDGLSCVSASNAGVGCPGAAGGTVTWSLGTIEAGDSVTLTITVRGEEVGTDWVNTATVTSPTDPTDSSDTANVTVTPMADLQIVKTGPDSVASGESFLFTLSVTNNGPDSAVTPEITDTLPAGIIYESHDFIAGSGICTIVGQLFSCDLPTMASGETIEVGVEVNAGFDYSEGSVTNTAHVESPVTTDTDPSNNTDDAVVDVGPNADVAIVKTGPDYGAAGYPLTYTLSVVNNGPATAEDVEVTDPLPAGLSYQSATPSVGSCSESSGTVSCALGDMALNATAQIVIVAVPQDSVVGTTVVNTATATSPTPDPNLTNNTSTVTTPIENNAYPTSSNVTITKTASKSSTKVGDTIVYTMTASNSGPDTARSVAVTDTIPGRLIYKSTAGANSCAFKSPVLTCQLGDIATGASKSFTMTAVVASTGSIVNTATVTAFNDRNPNDNSATAPIRAGKSTAKLSISKVATKKTVKVGRKATYRIRLKNVSKVTAVRVRVCDAVPPRLTIVRKDGGELVKGSLCWTVDTLSPGASRTFKPVFRVTNGNGVSVTNPVSARATNAKTVRAKSKIKVPARGARGGGTTG